MYIQYFDNDDRSLHLPYLTYHKLFTTFMNYRFIHSPFVQFTSIGDFDKLQTIIEDTDRSFIDIVGYYYDELANNIKEQIARNAAKRYFQGYPVYVLNYKDPVLYKMVAKQMLTNAEKKNDNIAFAVLWGYEYGRNMNDPGWYNVHLSEKARENLNLTYQQLLKN